MGDEMSEHVIRCKRTGLALCSKLDGGECVCAPNECRMQREFAARDSAALRPQALASGEIENAEFWPRPWRSEVHEGTRRSAIYDADGSLIIKGINNEKAALIVAFANAHAALTSPPSSEGKLREALASRVYTMSEPHLSGARLVIGFNTILDASAAQIALAALSPNKPSPDDGREGR